LTSFIAPNEARGNRVRALQHAITHRVTATLRTGLPRTSTHITVPAALVRHRLEPVLSTKHGKAISESSWLADCKPRIDVARAHCDIDHIAQPPGPPVFALRGSPTLLHPAAAEAGLRSIETNKVSSWCRQRS
jgi:hypothetical protein